MPTEQQNKIRVTEYLDLDVERGKWFCNRCGHEIGPARQSYKRGCLLYDRDPETVMEDLKKAIISDWTAVNIYKIAYNVARGKVDIEKTNEQRMEERKSRMARGKSYDDFEKDWNKKSPPKEALLYYGTWPDAKSTGPVFRP